MERFNLRDILKKLVLVIIVTIALYSLFVYFGRIALGEIYSIIPIVIFSSIFSVIAFILKGLRFYIIIKRLLPETNLDFVKSVWVRIASEIFSFIGVSYIGDEAFRVYYLNKSGVSAWKSLWATYTELGEEVLVASTIVVFGSLYYFLKGIHPLSIIIGVIVSIGILSINILFVMGSEKLISITNKLLDIFIKRFSSKLYNELKERLLKGTEESHSIKKVIIRDRKLLGITILISYLIALSSGLAFYIVFSFFSFKGDVLLSVYIVYLTLTISTLPVTIGGIGLSETYILYVGSEFSNRIPWLLPIAYRLSSYFIPMTICLILFLALVENEEKI